MTQPFNTFLLQQMQVPTVWIYLNNYTECIRRSVQSTCNKSCFIINFTIMKHHQISVTMTTCIGVWPHKSKTNIENLHERNVTKFNVHYWMTRTRYNCVHKIICSDEDKPVFSYQCQLFTLVPSGLSSTIQRGSPSPHFAILRDGLSAWS